MKNVFKFNSVKFNNGKFGARRLTIKGWLYVMNREYNGYTVLTPWTQDAIQFNTEEDAMNKAKEVISFVRESIRVI